MPSDARTNTPKIIRMIPRIEIGLISHAPHAADQIGGSRDEGVVPSIFCPDAKAHLPFRVCTSLGLSAVIAVNKFRRAYSPPHEEGNAPRLNGLANSLHRFIDRRYKQSAGPDFSVTRLFFRIALFQELLYSSIFGQSKGGIDEQTDSPGRYRGIRHDRGSRVVAAGAAARIGFPGEAVFRDAAREGSVTPGAPAIRRYSAG